MEDKKNDKKIDFLKIPKKQQEEILREALIEGQEEQKKLEREYDKILMQGASS